MKTEELERIFELMVKNNIETYKNGEIEITRKSLEIKQAEISLEKARITEVGNLNKR